MMAANVIITGITGLVGSHLARRLESKRNIIGISRNPTGAPESINLVQLNITEKQDLLSFLGKTDFDTIINCAAMADVDQCEIEREEAHRINTEAVETMAGFCNEHNRLFIHLSTDYIFDGKSGPYSEDATPNPINYYGLTKSDAEKAIINSSCQHLIVRTNHIYGNLPSSPSKLVNWLLQAKTGNIQAADDQYNNSTWAGNLADAIIELMDMNFRGVINIGGRDYLSRYDFAIKGAGILGYESSHVIKTSINKLGLKAPRPLKAGLTINKMRLILRTQPIGVLEGLKKVGDGAY